MSNNKGSEQTEQGKANSRTGEKKKTTVSRTNTQKQNDSVMLGIRTRMFTSQQDKETQVFIHSK